MSQQRIDAAKAQLIRSATNRSTPGSCNFKKRYFVIIVHKNIFNSGNTGIAPSGGTRNHTFFSDFGNSYTLVTTEDFGVWSKHSVPFSCQHPNDSSNS
jgi:hypothetical protein